MWKPSLLPLSVLATLLVLAAASAPPVLAQPTVSTISTTLATHSSVTIRFATSSVGQHVRVRFGTTTNYEAEGGCARPQCGIQDFDGYDTNTTHYIEVRVGGLAPATAYRFCPQVSDDGGSTWSPCVDHAESTLALPAVHPVPPIAPTPVPTTRPSTAGYTTRAVASDCTDLVAKLDAAADDLYNAGSIVSIPAGATCTASLELKHPPRKTWVAANVNTSTSTIAITSHGFLEGDLVMVAGSHPPGAAGPDTSCYPYRGLGATQRYYVKYVDANSIQLSLTNGGAAVPVSLASVPSHAVTNAGTFAVQESGAALTALQLIDDAVATTASAIPGKGLAISGTDGTNARVVKVDTNGELQVDVLTLPNVTVGAALPSGSNQIGGVNVSQINGVTPLMGAGNTGTGSPRVTIASDQAAIPTTPAGGVAHDGADSGNPLKVGARAINAEIAAVANNDRTDLLATLTGKLITHPYTNPENIVSGAITTAMTGTTSTSLVAAPGSGLRNYITTIIVSNAHATVGTDVIIQDGSGGTTLLTIPAAAVYGGAVITLPVPLRQPTTNTALYCANVTTGASTKVSAVGFKAA